MPWPTPTMVYERRRKSDKRLGPIVWGWSASHRNDSKFEAAEIHRNLTPARRLTSTAGRHTGTPRPGFFGMATIAMAS